MKSTLNLTVTATVMATALALGGLLLCSGCGPAEGTKPGEKSAPGAHGATTPGAAAAPAGSQAGGMDAAAAKQKGEALAGEKNCMKQCHFVGNRTGAPMFEDAIKARRGKLALYGQIVERLKLQDSKRYEQSKEKLDAISAETDPDKKLRLWLSAYLAKTTFDNAGNKMLEINPKLTPEEIEQLVAYLAGF